MNSLKLLLLLALTSLITFASCKKEEVDPKIGTWKSESQTVPFLGLVYFDVVFSEDNTVKIDVVGDPSNTVWSTTVASWVKKINDNTDLYEINSNSALGISQAIDEPFFKLSTTINGSSMDFTTYEADSIASVAESITETEISGTLEKQ